MAKDTGGGLIDSNFELVLRLLTSVTFCVREDG